MQHGGNGVCLLWVTVLGKFFNPLYDCIVAVRTCCFHGVRHASPDSARLLVIIGFIEPTVFNSCNPVGIRFTSRIHVRVFEKFFRKLFCIPSCRNPRMLRQCTILHSRSICSSNTCNKAAMCHYRLLPVVIMNRWLYYQKAGGGHSKSQWPAAHIVYRKCNNKPAGSLCCPCEHHTLNQNLPASRGHSFLLMHPGPQ